MIIHVFDVDRLSKRILDGCWPNLGAHKDENDPKMAPQNDPKSIKNRFRKMTKNEFKKKTSGLKMLGENGEGSAPDSGPREGFREFWNRYSSIAAGQVDQSSFDTAPRDARERGSGRIY